QLDYKGRFDPLHPDYKKLRYTMVSGGLNSRYYSMGTRIGLQYPSCPSCGAYAHRRASNRRVVIVGGNYLKPDQKESVCLYYDTASHSLQWSEIPPGGYRSGVDEYRNGELWVCTGTNGSNVSVDNGKTWKALPIGGYNACDFSSQYLWLCGNKGSVKRVAISSLTKP
ncbi:MAG: hypothetical protein LPK45_06320, partial [Bacteroidota bacterium]|nr:hypothetical protein [Bacteroidota bacterium]MDX5430687.1 hypothetical protein [Bacteroidota bacterium]MDX5469434.1 hypothetical protein [Bacteroidota bacterium]